jgi:hypothetical protein
VELQGLIIICTWPLVCPDFSAHERNLDWETFFIAPESNAQGRTFRMPGNAKWQLNGIADSLSQQLPLARQRRALSPYDDLGPGPAPIGVRQAGLKQVVSVETRADKLPVGDTRGDALCDAVCDCRALPDDASDALRETVGEMVGLSAAPRVRVGVAVTVAAADGVGAADAVDAA